MKRIISALLTACILMTMISCVFGITASAEETTYDSGNMPNWFFVPESWDNNNFTKNIEVFSDGGTRFMRDVSCDFGTDLSNSEISFDFKSNCDWKLYLRCDSEFKSGYIIGSSSSNNKGSLYIKKVDSSIALATTDGANFAGYSNMEWHRYTIGFKDYEDHTEIYVKIDGRKVPFIDGYAFISGDFRSLDYYDKNVTVINGALYDFNPIQTGNTYIKVCPKKDGLLINPYGAMYFRSVDADLSNKTDTFRIALVGDSITHGDAQDTVDGVWRITYNKELNKLFGNTFDCYNGGVSGGSAVKVAGGMIPYHYQNQYSYTKNFDADLAVLMFGTNDAGTVQKKVDGKLVLLEGDELAAAKTKFKTEYRQLIDGYLNKDIPVVITTSPYNYSYDVWVNGAIKNVVDWTVELANELNLPCLNMWDFSYGHEDWFYDKTHPNMLGKQQFAAHLYEFLTTSNDISLTKTADPITSPDFSNDLALHATPLTSYSGGMNINSFYSYKQYTQTESNELRYIDGSVTANYGAVSKDNYNLGTKWKVSFTNQLPNNNNGTVYNDNYNWENYRTSTFKVGGLTFMIYHQYNSVDKYTYYAYRLFMFNDEIADPCITKTYTPRASYDIEYNNGTIKITRTTDNTVLFDIDSSSVYNTIGNDYRFDNVGMTMCGYEYNSWTYWYDMTVAVFEPTEVAYNISNSDHGHIEYAGNQFDPTLKHYVGEKLTFTAVCDDFGCAFQKWVDKDGNKLSNNPEYTITLTEGENYLRAIFDSFVAYGDISLSATEGGSVTINGAVYNPNDDYEVGSTVTLGATADNGYKFVYWADGAGNVLSTDAEYISEMPKDATFKAVFSKLNASTVNVIFCNRVGKIITIQSVAANSAIALPALPQSYGYECNGWIINDTVTAAGTSVSFDSDTIVCASYSKAEETYTVSVDGGTIGNSGTTGRYKYNTKITVSFDTSVLGDGEVFYGWHVASSKNQDSVISHAEQYTFYVGANVSLTAVVKLGEIETKPVIDVTDVSLVNGGKNVSFLTERTITDDCTLVETGVIYTANAEMANAMTLENVGGSLYAYKTINKTPNGQLRMTLGSRDGSAITIYLTAYLIYTDKFGVTHTVYSNVFSNTTVSYSGTQEIIDEETDNF